MAVLRELPNAEQEGILNAVPNVLAEELRNALAETLTIPPALLNEIVRGNCVLFIGAGLSQEAGMPSSQRLTSALGYDSAEFTLLAAAERFEVDDRRGRSELCSVIKQEFEVASTYLKPGSHPFIANISQLSGLIITTNYDHLIENALGCEGKKPIVVSRAEDLTAISGGPHVVVKIHGDIDQPDTLVITQGDYHRRLASQHRLGGFGAFLASLLSTRTMIFVGYSMTDEDFRVIREFVSSQMIDTGGRPTVRTHYAILDWEEAAAEVLQTHLKIQVVRGQGAGFLRRGVQEDQRIP